MAGVRFLLRSCYSAMLVLLLMRLVFALPVAAGSDEPEPPVFADETEHMAEQITGVTIQNDTLKLHANKSQDISNLAVYYGTSVSSLAFVVENPLSSKHLERCKQWFSYGGCNITLDWKIDGQIVTVSEAANAEAVANVLGVVALSDLKFRIIGNVVNAGKNLPSATSEDLKVHPMSCKLHPYPSEYAEYQSINISMGLVTEAGSPAPDNECEMVVSFDNSTYKVEGTTTTPPPPTTTPSPSSVSTTSSSTHKQSASSSHVNVTEPSTTKKVCTNSKRQGGDYLDIIFFVFFGLSAIFLILALMFVLWCYRRARRFEKKFGPSKANSSSGLGSADATKGSADAILLQGKGQMPPSDADMSLKSFVQPDDEKEDSAGHADVKKAGVYDTLGPVRHNANHYEVIGDLNSTEQLQQ